MKSIKTAFVVVVMLVVVYGVWQMINKKPIGPPQGMDEFMAWNTGSLQPAGESGVPALTPPTVQAPGFGASPAPLTSDPADADNGAVMPSLRPAPAPALAASQAQTASPYPGTSSEDSWGQHASTHQQGSTAHDGHGGAHVIAPPTDSPVVGAPVVSASGGSSFTNSSFTSHETQPAEPAPSVYGQPNTAAAGATASDPAYALASTGFEMSWSKVQDQLAGGELAEALAELSLWYGSADVPADLQPEMLELLDQLAGAVIYSRQHLLEAPYEVKSGETLDDIALRYQVPAQLLANINGIADSSQLQPGQELKVVRGPFNALISLERQELTLIVDGRYAGRFAIGLGNDPAPRTGQFAVREKAVEKMFVARDGSTVPAGDDANPYGQYWIGLDGTLGIHGAAPAPQNGPRASTGSIIVEPGDARDLFAILSEDSRVIIRR